MNETVTAIVKDIRKGHRGAFAIATAEGIEGSITFSLGKSIWKEDTQPVKTDHVILSSLRKTPEGWRAMSARFLQPSDEQKQQHKQGEAYGP